MNFPFVGQAYTARSLNVDAQRCFNLYPEVDQTGKQVLALYGTPGLLKLATATAAQSVRGMKVSGAYLYVVSGNSVSRFDTNWVETTLGTIGTTSGPVSMETNGTQLMIVDGAAGYIVTESSGAFAQIVSGNFPAGTDIVGFLDGFFIVNSNGTQKFYISASYDGTTWAALDFASVEGSPDNIISFIIDHREAWFFGSRSIEVFANTGNATFPIQRIQGAFIEQGCAAAFSVAKGDNSILWLGSDERGAGIVWKANGYVPQRVSTHAIETALKGYSTLSDAIAYTYQADGHTYYVLTFPSAGKTWVFDMATGMWHERGYRNPSSGSYSRHRSNCYAFFNLKNVVGDFQNGKIYELSPTTYTDDGDPIISLRSCQHISDPNENVEMTYSRLEVLVEAGVGLQTGQGSAPLMLMRHSKDGGHTWSSPITSTVGAVGKYQMRAKWERCGKGRDKVFEVSISDPVKRVIAGANLRATKGRA